MSEYICELEDARYEMTWAPKEEIVRCRDCREYNTELYEHITCELLMRYVEPSGFCAWAERKERIEQ